MAVIDVNDFRLYNEAFGHHVGDIILNTVAQVISRSLNKNDVLVRYGGDEFLVIFNDIEKEEFYHKLSQLSELVSRAAVPGYSQIQLSVCIGGIYANSILLSDAVTKADISAQMENGVLAITVKKPAEKSDSEKYISID